MGAVKVEIWAWPGDPRASLNDVKRQMTIEDSTKHGMTALELLNRIAEGHESFRRYIFDRSNMKFHPHVVVVFNKKITNMSELSETVLQDGDEIIIVPAAGGG